MVNQVSSRYRHGGDIYSLAEELMVKPSNILDFSSSLNPIGPPPSVMKMIKNLKKMDIMPYPDSISRRLKRVIGENHNLEPEYIVCGNGSTEIIYLIMKALRPQRLIIPVPTFNEYERAFNLYGKRDNIFYFYLKDNENFEIRINDLIEFTLKNLIPDETIVFLCNPNNPTGRLIKRDDMFYISQSAERYRFYLVIDEAFMDFVPYESIINMSRPMRYTIVLRSLTKFFGIAGLRLGYGIFHPDLSKIINEYKEPWSVNTIAEMAGINALQDRGFIEKTLRFMKNERRYFEKNLKASGIEYIPSDVNYYLIRINGARRLSRFLKMRGILVRECMDFRNLDSEYLRIAVKGRMENRILFDLLREYLEKEKFHETAQSTNEGYYDKEI